jgi:D-tyrosyl-tRNA(Tyr) deacylase
MKVVLQRVRQGQVTVEGRIVGEIGHGMVLLVGFAKGDDESCISPMVEKILALRIFPNEAGRFDKNVVQADGEILFVSQFTLLADTNSGRRPDFIRALEAAPARVLCDSFVAALRASPVKRVATGEFGADMRVSLTNDGPVTLILES